MIENLVSIGARTALGSVLVLGVAACGGGAETSRESSPDTETVSDSPEPDESTPPPREAPKNGFKLLPDCSQFAQSIVRGEDITDEEHVEGASCWFAIGEDPVVARQSVWITRGGGGWPAAFERTALTDMLAAEIDGDSQEVDSSVSEIKAPGWAYGVRFDATVDGQERRSYRLFEFAKNGDALVCHAGVQELDMKAFQNWCDDVKAQVER